MVGRCTHSAARASPRHHRATPFARPHLAARSSPPAFQDEEQDAGPRREPRSAQEAGRPTRRGRRPCFGFHQRPRRPGSTEHQRSRRAGPSRPRERADRRDPKPRGGARARSVAHGRGARARQSRPPPGSVHGGGDRGRSRPRARARARRLVAQVAPFSRLIWRLVAAEHKIREWTARGSVVRVGAARRPPAGVARDDRRDHARSRARGAIVSAVEPPSERRRGRLAAGAGGFGRKRITRRVVLGDPRGQSDPRGTPVLVRLVGVRLPLDAPLAPSRTLLHAQRRTSAVARPPSAQAAARLLAVRVLHARRLDDARPEKTWRRTRRRRSYAHPRPCSPHACSARGGPRLVGGCGAAPPPSWLRTVPVGGEASCVRAPCGVHPTCHRAIHERFAFDEQRARSAHV